MTERLYRIGELAAISGVPSKTIRFYSDIGALPPTRVAQSGYRLYSDADRGRLDLIRALRETGVDLATIGDLLRAKASVAETLALQLEATEAALRTARRQRALLKAALSKGEESALAYLDRARAIARLNALDRERFLHGQMERVFADVPADEAWKAHFWQGAVLDLPEELTEAQFAAWLELADLMTDESFLQRLNEMGREAWGARPAEGDAVARMSETNALYTAAAEASRAGHTPDGARGQELVTAYLTLQAEATGRVDDPAFPAELLAQIERHTDRRAARYWELIGILKGWPVPSPIAVGHDWLMTGLRWRVGKEVADSSD